MMAKQVRIAGVCEFDFDLVITVDDDFDPGLHEPVLDPHELAAGAVDGRDYADYRTVELVKNEDNG